MKMRCAGWKVAWLTRHICWHYIWHSWDIISGILETLYLAFLRHYIWHSWSRVQPGGLKSISKHLVSLGLRHLFKGASTNPASLASQMCEVKASWVSAGCGFFKGLPLACSVSVDFSGWPVVAGCILWSTVYPGKRFLAFKLGTTRRHQAFWVATKNS